ncbi:unnamed protein product [[Candida] boidinii]|uniref:Unnamed protein product n=1 Tax=Candida boidinii TaxID=5477 RepID=A0ACB5TGF1_CANBO|nr:unnamed protein product [[Candida] boidinii]
MDVEDQEDIKLNSLIDNEEKKLKNEDPQSEFDNLSDNSKLEKLDELVKSSQVFSSIIADTLLESTLRAHQPAPSTEATSDVSTGDQAAAADQTNTDRPVRRGRGRRKVSEINDSKRQFTLMELSEDSKKTKAKLTEAAETDKNQNGDSTNKSKQPKLLSGVTLKDYQLTGMDWLVTLYQNGLNGILADEMGLGKTIQCIAMLTYLYEKGVEGPFIVVCPLSTTSNWVNEFQKCAPDLNVIGFFGTKDYRKKLKAKFNSRKNQKFDVVITSFEISIVDSLFLNKFNWKFLIVDEGHRLKNHNCKLIRYLKKMKTSNRLLLTGTPLQNNLNELWSLLNFILPEIFHDVEMFEKWFDFTNINKLKDENSKNENDDEFNLLLNAKIQKTLIENLHTILKPFLLRRLKKDVLKGELPPKREYIIYSKLTERQEFFYNELQKGSGSFKSCLVENCFYDFLNYNDVYKKFPQIKQKFVKSFIEKKLEIFKDKIVDSDFVITEKDEKPLEPLAKRRRVDLYQERIHIKDFLAKIPLAEQILNVYWEHSFYELKLKSTENKLMQLRLICESPFLFYYPFNFVPNKKETRDMNKKLIKDKIVANFDINSDYQKFRDDSESEDEEEFYRKDNRSGVIIDSDDEEDDEEDEDDLIIVDPKVERAMQKKAIEILESSSCKFQILRQLIPELLKKGNKILIFSQFTSLLDFLKEYINIILNQECFLLTGVMQESVRRKQIEEFQTPGCLTKIFLLSTRAGGLGINLTAADTVILFDSDWNPQVDLQAMDRCHRIGQKKPVVIYRFAVSNTVEELLLARADSKRRLEKLVIQMGNFENLAKSIKGPSDTTGGAASSSSASSFIASNKQITNSATLINELNNFLKHKEFKAKSELKDNKLSKEELKELTGRTREYYNRSSDFELDPKMYPHLNLFETVSVMN